MLNVYQLAYASQANVTQGEKGIDLEVGRILLKSKNNNSKLNIGGVLYYADGYFFQVLEGDKDAVCRLYEKLCKDERHSHVKILAEGFIDQPMFSNWSMHFVPTVSSIRQLLRDYDLNRFTPFSFSVPLVKKLIEVLSLSGQYTPDKVAIKKPASGGIFGAIRRVFS